MVKFKIDFNETSDLPELVFEFNTASNGLEEKVFRRFTELANDTDNFVLHLNTEALENGVTQVTLQVEVIPQG